MKAKIIEHKVESATIKYIPSFWEVLFFRTKRKIVYINFATASKSALDEYQRVLKETKFPVEKP